jgi:uncharacterized protein YndB with AHSA1/START domain
MKEGEIMPDILHRVGIKATPRKVFEALSTVEGLCHWWITDTKGNAKQGGIIHFGFADMKVVEASPSKQVKWKCVKGPKEWLDTEIIFQLKVKKDETVVLFTHANWKKPDEFMRHCSTKWATFLLSLKGWLERDEGRPSPYDVKIGVGD